MSYNERVQRREEEIESLQEALKILGAPRGAERSKRKEERIVEGLSEE